VGVPDGLDRLVGRLLAAGQSVEDPGGGLGEGRLRARVSAKLGPVRCDEPESRRGRSPGRPGPAILGGVRPALERWAARGTAARVFSSGSVEAQRLLFRHSTAGDLTPLIAGYFDTTTGQKRDPASYRAIARASAIDPEATLFLTDAVEEALAADAGGMRAALLARPGNAPLPAHDFPVLADFESL